MHIQHVHTCLLALSLFSNLFSSSPTPYRDLPRSLKDGLMSQRSFETVHKDRRKLHDAIAHGYLNGARYLLKNQHIDPSESIDNHHTWLSLAAERGYANIVKMLLCEYNVNPNTSVAQAARGALNSACRYGHLEVVKLLLQHGADPNLSKHRHPLQELICMYQNQDACDMTKASFTPNGIVQREEIARLLIQHGAQVHKLSLFPLVGKALFGCNPKGAGSMIQLLLDHGADASTRYTGKTALTLATENNYPDAVAVLCKHQAKQFCAPIRTGDLTTLQAWAEGDQFHRDVLSARTEHDNTLLHVACTAGHKALIALLLAHGARVQLQNDNQDTPLHLACSSSTNESRSELATLLLQYQAPVQAVNTQKHTPLMLAVRAEDPALVATLLAANSPIDSVDANKDTVLHLAARAGDITIAHCLARAQACCTQRNGAGKLPFELATDHNNPEVAQLLQQAYLSEVLRTLPPAALRMLGRRLNPPAPAAQAQAASQSSSSSEAAVELIMHDSVSHASSASAHSGFDLSMHGLSSRASLEQSHEANEDSDRYSTISEISSHAPATPPYTSSVQSVSNQSAFSFEQIDAVDVISLLSFPSSATPASDNSSTQNSGNSAFSLVGADPLDIISLSSASVVGTE